MRRTLCWRQRGADQTDPSLIHPIDFRFSSLLGFKLPNTQTPSLICQSLASDRSPGPRVVLGCPGSALMWRVKRGTEDATNISSQSSVMASDGGWQLINNERIPFNLWPGSFPDRVCHTDFSLHLSHLTTLLPETKRSKSPERHEPKTEVRYTILNHEPVHLLRWRTGVPCDITGGCGYR